jgi:hypothetical protein
MFLVLFGAVAFAQTGTIQGTLTDSSGAVIPNAKITATDQAKQVTRVKRSPGRTAGSTFATSCLASTP